MVFLDQVVVHRVQSGDRLVTFPGCKVVAKNIQAVIQPALGLVQF